LKYEYKTLMNRNGEWIYEDGTDMRESWTTTFGHEPGTTDLLNHYGAEGWLVTTDHAYAYGDGNEEEVRRIIMRRELA
jgi:hypothetical protein